MLKGTSASFYFYYWHVSQRLDSNSVDTERIRNRNDWRWVSYNAYTRFSNAQTAFEALRRSCSARYTYVTTEELSLHALAILEKRLHCSPCRNIDSLLFHRNFYLFLTLIVSHTTHCDNWAQITNYMLWNNLGQCNGIVSKPSIDTRSLIISVFHCIRKLSETKSGPFHHLSEVFNASRKKKGKKTIQEKEWLRQKNVCNNS